MPSYGLTSFLPQHINPRDIVGGVSMPLLGLTSFLRSRSIRKAINSGVSMPLIGLISFLHKTRSKEKGTRTSVNALTRALIISTKYPVTIIAGSNGTCQCPHTGLPYFYGTPSQPQCLCGFPDLFLQVFNRIF